MYGFITKKIHELLVTKKIFVQRNTNNTILVTTESHMGIRIAFVRINQILAEVSWWFLFGTIHGQTNEF